MNLERSPTFVFSSEGNVDVGAAWIRRGGQLAEEKGLSGKLGLTQGRDQRLLELYLAQRLLRISIYNSSQIFSRPGIHVIRRIPLLSNLVHHIDSRDRRERNGLLFVEQFTAYCIRINYPNFEECQRTRTIELAVNDLVARATATDSKNPVTKIRITPELLTTWGERWQAYLHGPP